MSDKYATTISIVNGLAATPFLPFDLPDGEYVLAVAGSVADDPAAVRRADKQMFRYAAAVVAACDRNEHDEDEDFPHLTEWTERVLRAAENE